MIKFLHALSFILVLLSIQTFASAQVNEEQQARAALQKFVTAFENLDWEGFRSSFDDNATVFYPRGMARRATGRPEFEAGFRKVFEQIRDGKTKPPFHHINAKQLQVQMVGDVAIFTFHLEDRPGFVSRRTIVMHRTERGWKIIHLHASEVKP